MLVGDDDPREALHGQCKVVLKRGTLQPLDVLGIYTGKMHLATDQPPDSPLLDLGRSNTFAYQFNPKPGSVVSLTDLPATIIVQPYPSYGNKLMAINDKKNSGAPANCEFFEFLHRGVPAVAKIATRTINAGDELMTDYSQQFWMDQKILDNVYGDPLSRFGSAAQQLLDQLQREIGR